MQHSSQSEALKRGTDYILSCCALFAPRLVASSGSHLYAAGGKCTDICSPELQHTVHPNQRDNQCIMPKTPTHQEECLKPRSNASQVGKRQTKRLNATSKTLNIPTVITAAKNLHQHLLCTPGVEELQTQCRVIEAHIRRRVR